MTFCLSECIETHLNQARALYGAHVNPRFAQAMKLIGFDRVYVRAQGSTLWDDAGHAVLDMLAGYGVFNIGRNHPTVKQALIDFMNADFVNLVQLDIPALCGVLAQELKKRVGYALENVYFCSTGAEANETAIKFARRATGREKIVYTSSAFHGLTTGALALNGGEVFRERFGPLIGSVEVKFGDLQALESAFSSQDVAAFFVEPIQGKGVAIPPQGYLAEASALCKKYGVLFVVDEVQTGVGRAGSFLALHQEASVDPDMVLLSKALSGGFVPIGAVLMRKSIYDSVFSSLDRAVVHSSTFGKSNFAMVAGLATLSVLDQENILEKARISGQKLLDGLLEIKNRHEFISEIRGRGLMIGIEFGKPQSLKLKAAWNTVQALSQDLFCQAVTIPLLQDHHILTQVAGNKMPVIKLTPPLVIEDHEIERFLKAFEAVMIGLHRFPGPAWESLLRIAKNSLR